MPSKKQVRSARKMSGKELDRLLRKAQRKETLEVIVIKPRPGKKRR